jgi:hypothetical protein
MFSYRLPPASIVILALAMSYGAMSGTAFGRSAYDGDWSVLIATNRGACDSSYRYGVRISGGRVIYDGSMVTMHGQVTPKGAVRVMLQSGSQWANGSGHLINNRGGGIWRGQGTGGTCSGTFSIPLHGNWLEKGFEW